MKRRATAGTLAVSTVGATFLTGCGVADNAAGHIPNLSGVPNAQIAADVRDVFAHCNGIPIVRVPPGSGRPVSVPGGGEISPETQRAVAELANVNLDQDRRLAVSACTSTGLARVAALHRADPGNDVAESLSVVSAMAQAVRESAPSKQQTSVESLRPRIIQDLARTDRAFRKLFEDAEKWKAVQANLEAAQTATQAATDNAAETRKAIADFNAGKEGSRKLVLSRVDQTNAALSVVRTKIAAVNRKLADLGAPPVVDLVGSFGDSAAWQTAVGATKGASGLGPDFILKAALVPLSAALNGLGPAGTAQAKYLDVSRAGVTATSRAVQLAVDAKAAIASSKLFQALGVPEKLGFS
ncbi:MAG: hypothetical protein ACT4TC_05030 [Myxococcaceae bacterium]